MSDQSDTSINEEWEAISDSSQETELKMETLRGEIMRMKIEMNKKDEEISKKNTEISEKTMEIEKKDSELKSLREKEEVKDKENGELRSNIATVSPTTSMEEWMRVQMESVKLSSLSLTVKTLEVYMKIMENELARAQATTSSDRKKMSKAIQKMEGLCGQISKDVMKNNKKYTTQLTSLLNRTKSSSAQKPGEETVKNTPIESFLGEFTVGKNEQMSLLGSGKERLLLRTIIIRKSIVEGYFEICWKYDCGKENVTLPWAPDNIERDGRRFRIEKNVLIRVLNHTVLRFVLQDNNLIFNGSYLYTRNREEISSKQQINNNITARNLSIESFLGEYTAGENDPMALMQNGTEQVPVRTMIIRKAKKEGFFETEWKFDNGEARTSVQWAPDNVERNGFRYRIEKNVLVRVYEHGLCCYSLTDQGLLFNRNYTYARA